EAFVSGILELLRIPFTGSTTQPLILARSKPLTKALLAGSGVPTARFRSIDQLPVPALDLSWPLIVKPAKEDASVGIEQASVVMNQTELEARVATIGERYGWPVLVEQFITGREFNVAVWDRGDGPRTLPFSEILFIPDGGATPLWPLVTFDAKWHPNSRDFQATPAKNPADVTPELAALVTAIAIQAFELVGCRDYARVDFRVDDAGQPYVLEVNPNPCISPLAGLAAALETAKIPYAEFILSLLRAALKRGPKPELAEFEVNHFAAEAPPQAPVPNGETLARRKRIKVRPMRRNEMDIVAEILFPADAMASEDRAPALAQLQEVTRRRPGARWQHILVAVLNGEIGAAIVQAPEAFSAPGIASVLALGVRPALRNAGLTEALLETMEVQSVAAGLQRARMEVSSGPTFAPLRRTLEAGGYRALAEVPEFYKDGTARQTFLKVLPVPAPIPAPAPESTSLA
ncbi:MAG: ATP-grasp domain-containing protein, partial [Gemmataceae bacterium]